MNTKDMIQKTIQKRLNDLLKEYMLIVPKDERDDKEIVNMLVGFLKKYADQNYSNTKDFDITLEVKAHGNDDVIFYAKVSDKVKD